MAEGGNIKTFESPIDKLTPTNVGAEAFEMEGRHVEANYAGAGQKIGSAVQGLGEQLEQHDTTVQTADLMKNMSDLEVKAHSDLLNARSTMDIHDPDAVNKFMDQYKDQVDAIAGKTYTTKAYDSMTRMTSEFDARMRNSFNDYQSQAVANETIANYHQSIDNWAIMGSQDPNFAQLGVDAVKEMAKTLPREQQAAEVLKGTNHVMDITAEGIVSRVEGAKVYDPAAVQAAKDYINDPKNGFINNGMSASKYQEVMNRLDNARRTGTHETTAGIRLNTPQMLDQMSQTGIVPQDYNNAIAKAKALGTPEGDALATELVQNGRDAIEGSYPARQTVAATPADKMAETIDNMKTASLNSNLSASDIAIKKAQIDAADKLWKGRREAFDGGDPAKQSGWMIQNNPAIMNAYDAWRKNRTPENFAAYANKSMAMQRFLEPGTLPSVTTPDMEADAKRVMNEITGPGGPNQSIQDLNKMANMYGSAWPLVVGDLAKKKIFTGNQLVMAGLNSPSQAVWRQDLATVSAFVKQKGQKALDEQSGISREKAIGTVRDEFAPLIASMGNMNNAPEIINTYMNAAADLVQLHKMDEAHDLVKTMFLDSFQFVGPGNSIRLGANRPDGDAVGDGAAAVLHDIGNHDLIVPSSSRLGSINAKEAWADAIGANGVWNTSASGNTATLYDGHGNPVLERRNGRVVPVEIDFDELARLGQTRGLSNQQVEEQESHVK